MQKNNERWFGQDGRPLNRTARGIFKPTFSEMCHMVCGVVVFVIYSILEMEMSLSTLSSPPTFP